MDLWAFLTHVAGYASIVLAIYLRHRNDPLVVEARRRLAEEAARRLKQPTILPYQRGPEGAP